MLTIQTTKLFEISVYFFLGDEWSVFFASSNKARLPQFAREYSYAFSPAKLPPFLFKHVHLGIPHHHHIVHCIYIYTILNPNLPIIDQFLHLELLWKKGCCPPSKAVTDRHITSILIFRILLISNFCNVKLNA